MRTEGSCQSAYVLLSGVFGTGLGQMRLKIERDKKVERNKGPERKGTNVLRGRNKSCVF